jgi:NADH-quinone oxidoreductase subunit L
VELRVSVGVDAKLQILVDPLSVFMVLVVSGVSTLIHLYSISYMTSTAATRATSPT